VGCAERGKEGEEKLRGGRVSRRGRAGDDGGAVRGQRAEGEARAGGGGGGGVGKLYLMRRNTLFMVDGGRRERVGDRR